MSTKYPILAVRPSARGKKGDPGEQGPPGIALTTLGPIRGPSTVNLTGANVVLLINQDEGNITITFPDAEDGAVITVKSVSEELYPSNSVQISADSSIEDPAVPTESYPFSNSATFIGQRYKESYTWVYSSSANAWVIAAYYEYSTNNTSEEFTVATDRTVQKDQVVSLYEGGSVEGATIAGYSLPGSTRLPNELADVRRYRNLNSSEGIIFCFTDTYVVLISVDSEERPTFGTPYYLEDLGLNTIIVDAIRVSDSNIALLYKNTVTASAGIVALSTDLGTLNFTTTPQSSESLVDQSDIEALCLCNDTDAIVTFTSSNATHVRMQPFEVTGSDPPNVTTTGSQSVFNSVGTLEVQSLEAVSAGDYYTVVLCTNRDGITQELRAVRRASFVFGSGPATLCNFTIPYEFAKLAGLSILNTVVLTAERTNRYSLYQRVDRDFLPLVIEDSVIPLPVGTLVENVRLSLLEGERVFAIGDVDRTTAAYSLGAVTLAGISWGDAEYGKLPLLSNPLYVNTTVAISSVSYPTQGGEVLGITSFTPNTALELITPHHYEGSTIIGIAQESGTDGETIRVTTSGIHEMSVALDKGKLYWANLDGNIGRLVTTVHEQFKEVSSIGIAVSQYGLLITR